MIAFRIGHTAQLDNLQAAAHFAILGRNPIQGNNTMHQAIQRQIVIFEQIIAEQEGSATQFKEALAQGEQLLAIAQRGDGQQANLGDRIEDNPLGLNRIQYSQNLFGHLIQFHLGRRKDSLARGCLGNGHGD